MGARWYEGSWAAFLSRDTVFGELSTPMSLNRYTYAYASPLNYWDPDGQLSIEAANSYDNYTTRPRPPASRPAGSADSIERRLTKTRATNTTASAKREETKVVQNNRRGGGHGNLHPGSAQANGDWVTPVRFSPTDLYMDRIAFGPVAARSMNNGTVDWLGGFPDRVANGCYGALSFVIGRCPFSWSNIYTPRGQSAPGPDSAAAYGVGQMYGQVLESGLTAAIASIATGGLGFKPVPAPARLTNLADDAAVLGSQMDDILPHPTVVNPALQNIVTDLYKGTIGANRVGTGTTADAVRNELATGLPTWGTFHSQKAEQYSNALRSVLKQDLSFNDRLVAQSLLDDLQNALGGLP